MDEQITLKSGKFSARILSIGAELASLNDGEREYVWQGDVRYWTAHAPILFPVAGGLMGDGYFLNGKEYSLQKHGFARKMPFQPVEQSENRVTFLLTDTPSTREVFPYYFEFLVTFTLKSGKLTIEYRVKNKSDGDMYLTIGAHEGYALYDDFGNYAVRFEKKENLDSFVLDGNLLTYEKIDYGRDTDILPLSYDYFKVDATVFKDIRSRKVWLEHKTKGRILSVEFDDFKHLLLWTKPNAKYICIEPWSAVQDFTDSDREIAHKPDVTSIPGGGEKSWKHTIDVGGAKG